MLPCIYRGPELEGKLYLDEQVSECYVHGHCVHAYRDGMPSCEGCQSRLDPYHKKFTAQWQDPLHILDRHRAQTLALRGILAGRPAFLFCGGPSANQYPLEALARRGAWVMAVNNTAGHPKVRPQAFVCADPPEKFTHSVWLDPGVMKFIPTQKLKRGGKGVLRRKLPDGTFERLPGGTIGMPNVWGYERRSWMRPDETFFTLPSAAWGNHDEGVAETGEEKTVCTMLLGLRLLRHMGAGAVYLLGVDFWMQAGNGYSFDQGRDTKAAATNNSQFRVVNEWLCRMQANGVFTRFGLTVYNLNPVSGLRAFPHVPFDKALEVACNGIEQVPDLRNWYEK